MKLKLFLIILFELVASYVSAQELKLELTGEKKDSFKYYSQLKDNCSSLTECFVQLQEAKQKLFAQGFLGCSIDSIYQFDSTLVVQTFLGEKYQWASLRNGNIPEHLLIQYRFNPSKYFGKAIQPQSLNPLFEKIVRYYEDNGYPFCSLQLDSLTSSKGMAKGILKLNTGPLTKLDTIILNEEVNISRNYVLRQLGLKQKMLYNESKIKAISNRIREISFLAESYPWRMDFTTAKSTLNLYLKTKSANRADVLIGLLPNNDELGGKFLLTGDIKLGFTNALGQGEQIQLNWQNLQYKSPRYDIHFALPYLLNSAIGITGKFDFYKKDTTFKTTKGEVGLLYQISNTNQLKVYYELNSNRLGTVNINSLLLQRTLPANGDVNYKTFGAELQWSQTDYKPNPRKGFRFILNGSVSLRKLRKNTTIENTYDPIAGKNFAYLYDSISLNNTKYTILGHGSIYHPLSKRLIMVFSYSGAITYSKEPLFRNELFQIGGYRLLRGFDEGSLFVNQYHIATLEPKFVLSQNSYLFVFADAGYIQANYLKNKHNDAPYSFGAGMTFETKAGLFNLSYGVGATQAQGIRLKGSKIHFGYINYF